MVRWASMGNVSQYTSEVASHILRSRSDYLNSMVSCKFLCGKPSSLVSTDQSLVHFWSFASLEIFFADLLLTTLPFSPKRIGLAT